ncbi:MAG: hypothetical protein EBS01_11585 [Verrucomicrobia bacterium]|nr:hypothetical protein [Verrucomicrobiota bacterium]
MKPNTLRRLHRWLGLLFSLSILMSTLSGILHTVMTRTQAPPPPARPSGGALDPATITCSIAEALAKLPPETGAVRAVNVRGISGAPWYQIYTQKGGPPRYLSAQDGHEDPSQDERYAEEIASAFLGGAPVQKTDFLNAFNREYLNIFRVLPVYRFDSPDGQGTRVYVSTTTGSVTRHTDNRRQFEANFFSNFHKLAFIPDKALRDWVLVGLTSATAIVALAGVALFWVTRPRRNRT